MLSAAEVVGPGYGLFPGSVPGEYSWPGFVPGINLFVSGFVPEALGASESAAAAIGTFSVVSGSLTPDTPEAADLDASAAASLPLRSSSVVSGSLTPA